MKVFVILTCWMFRDFLNSTLHLSQRVLVSPEKTCVLPWPGTVLCRSAVSAWLMRPVLVFPCLFCLFYQLRKVSLRVQLLSLSSRLLPSILLDFALCTLWFFCRAYGIGEVLLMQCVRYIPTLERHWLKGLLDGTAVSWPILLTEGFVELTSSPVQLVPPGSVLCVWVNSIVLAT